MTRLVLAAVACLALSATQARARDLTCGDLAAAIATPPGSPGLLPNKTLAQ